MARRPRYSSEFKAQAVRMVLEDGRKVCEVADQPVLSPDTLKNWLRAARAGKTFPAQHVDAKDLELERLRHEVRTLRMECEILKKTAANLRNSYAAHPNIFGTRWV